PTPHLSTLSLHDALPIYPWPATSRAVWGRPAGSLLTRGKGRPGHDDRVPPGSAPSSHDTDIGQQTSLIGADRPRRGRGSAGAGGDRKSTRLNSSHSQISY